jgi:hypothetical protein
MRGRLVNAALALGLALLVIAPTERVERKAFVKRGDHFGEGRLEEVSGVRILHLYGRPFELGYEQGALMKEELAKLRQESWAFLRDYAHRSTGLPSWLAGPLAKPLLTYWARRFLPNIPADYKEELQGMAEGSGISFNELLIFNVIWEIAELFGCSEIAVGPPKTRGGLWHGYNFDLTDRGQAYTDAFKAVIFFHPAGRLKFVSVNYLGLAGVYTGMNEAGISMAWDNTRLLDKPATRDQLKEVPRTPMPFVFAVRQVLEQARTLDQAVKIITSQRRPLGDIVIIASREEGRAVAVETFGTESAVREMAEGAVWSANVFASEQMGGYDWGEGKLACLAGGELSAEAPVFRSRIFSRYLRYQELIQSPAGPIGPAEMIAMLRDPYPQEAQGYGFTGERAIGSDRTSLSVVYDLAGNRLWAGIGRTPSPLDRWVEVDFTGEALGEEIPATGFFEARAGYEQMRKGNFLEAQRDLSLALEKEPDNVRVRQWLEQCRLCAEGAGAEACGRQLNPPAFAAFPDQKIFQKRSEVEK